MGLFGSKKKNVDADELPAVPPRFAPDEVHTAYKEALAKDALPPTQLPPEPKTLQQAPIQDSLAPMAKQDDASAGASVSQASSSPSLDDAVSNEPKDFSQEAQSSVSQSESVSDDNLDPLSSPVDAPVSQAPAQEPVSTPTPATSVQEEALNPSISLAPEGEVPAAPSPEPDVPVNSTIPNSSSPANTPVSQSESGSAPLEEKVSSFKTDTSAGNPVSPPVVDVPSSQANYTPSSVNSTSNYIPNAEPALPENFSDANHVSDDLSPIAPQDNSQQDFDEGLLPEIGVPVDEYTSNMAAKPKPGFKPSTTQAPPDDSQSSSQNTMAPFDLEPPAKPSDLPSTMPEDNPNDLVAPELAPLDTSNKVYAAAGTTVVAPSTPSQSSSQELAPMEERVILKHAVGTDVFVEKYVYEESLLDISGVQNDLQSAGSHLDKVLRDELAVTKKIADWNNTLNVIQEKLMTIDIRLFEKGDA